MTKTIVITGASDGIGAAAARELVALGEHVVVVGRSPMKTKAIAEELGVDYFTADFAKLSEVRAFAANLKKKYKRIDVLANNAGGMLDSSSKTEDGFGLAFQVNYLAPFLLTYLLLDRLTASGATIINTSSMAHLRAGPLRFDDLAHSIRHSGWGAYAGVKLLNILFTREFKVRYARKGVSAVAFHPGVVKTSFGTEGSKLVRAFYGSWLASAIFLTPAQGADTLVWLATHEANKDWKPGEYYVKRKVAQTSREARDMKLATKVWNETLTLLDLTQE